MNAVKQGYKETKGGIIPEDWNVVKLEAISDFITKGATPTTYGFNWQEDGIPFLRSECVSGNGLNLKAAMYICQDAHNVMKRSTITSGDILMTITGNVGRVILLENFQEGNINQHIARIRIIKEIANRNFIFSFLSQSTYQINYSKITTGQAYPQLSLVQVRDSFVVLPPLKEQEKIANILTTWDEAINKQKELIKIKELQKKALMQKLLSGDVRFSGFNDEWQNFKLEEVGKIVTGTTPPTDVKEYYKNGLFPWITPTDINDKKNINTSERYLTSLGIEKGRFVPKGSLLVTCIASIGKNAILTVDGSCNQQINAVLPSEKNNINYLYYFIEYKKDYLIKFAGQSATQILNKKSFSSLKIKLPTLKEQEKISEVLSFSDKEIDLLKKELEEFKQQKKALMQKLLTGEVRVKV
jgi:type I restriction enzyme S subunit